MMDELRGDEVVYSILRRLFLSEPTEALLQSLAGLPVGDGPGGEDDGLAVIVEDVRRNGSALDSYARELSLEYVRLFLGPVGIPVVPFSSYYLSEAKQLMTDETIDVRKRYLDAGMAVRELHSIPDDHIGIELEFLFSLTRQIIELRESGRDTESLKIDEMRQAFLRDHCALWFPALADRILTSTESPFFRGAALLLKESVSEM